MVSGRKFARDHTEVKAEEAGGDAVIKGSEPAKIHHQDEMKQPAEADDATQ